MKILWDVVEEHLEEASFLWTQWESALRSHRYTLDRVLEGPEERLQAHLNGLAIHGAEAESRVLVPALKDGEPEHAFVAASILAGSRGGLERLAASLQEEDDPARRDAIGRALELTPGIDLQPLLEGPARQVALRVLAFQQRSPLPGLEALLSTTDPGLLPLALRAAELAAPARARGLIESHLDSSLGEVRVAAIEAGVALGLGVAWAACRELAALPEGAPLLALLGVSGADGDLVLLERALDTPGLRPAALFALGFSGRPRAVDLCLQHLADADCARVAGEAVSAISGLAIEGEYLQQELEEEEAPLAPLPEEDLDANLVPGPEALLPLPRADAVGAWWKASRGKFDPAVRFLGGQPLSATRLVEAIRSGPMRRRHVLALELLLRSGGKVRLQSLSWARDQRRAEGGLRLPPDVDLHRPLKGGN